ncbi:MAG: ABC transporter permease [Pseudomonadota bacterium]|nr:ABC transporter permease [Pseudomonadota bacterium]
MSVYLAKRCLTFVLTLWGASVAIFLVMNVIPGDPALIILGLDSTADAQAALTRKLGLDRPLVEQYLHWAGGLLRGDMGVSYTFNVPVADLITERLEITLMLALIAMALTLVIALSLGLLAAENRGKPADWGVMALGQLGIAIPSFWLAILAVIVFAVQLRWLPSGGYPGLRAGVGPALLALVMPALSLALVQSAILARVTRSALLEVNRLDFVRTARAKGLSRRATLWRHVLRNAMIPVITIAGLQFANLLTGTIIIENVFSLPGLGRLVFQSITNRDLPVVQALVMSFAALVIVVNFIVDLVYARIDPRLTAADA